MKKLVTLFFAMGFVISCSPGKKEDKKDKFDPEVLGKLSSAYCASSLTLAEDREPLSLSAEFLNSKSKVVGFFKEGEVEGSCVLIKDYSEIWGQNNSQWLKIDINNSCLESGSLWEITSWLESEGGVNFDLKRIDRQGTPNMHMEISKSLKLAYVKELFGFGLVTCQNP